MLCVCFASRAQNNNFYYANGVAQYWEDDSTSANIIVRNQNNYDTIVCGLNTIFNDIDDEILSDNEDANIIINSSSLAIRTRNGIINNVSVSSEDIGFFSYSKIVNGSHIWLTNEVYVKLKDSLYYSAHILPVISQNQDVSTYYEGDNEYRIVCNTEEQVVSIANQLYDTSYVVYSTPDFYSEVDLCTNDEYYDKQWNLKNIGNEGGIVGVDIKAEESWNFLNKVFGEPGSNVKVAVIDDGVEEHDDLYLEGGVSKVLNGYTANGYGTGRPRKTGSHGQMCAGVIAAVHNNIVIAGVASNARIVPIRIFKEDDKHGKDQMFSNAKVANAIKKSWDEFNCPVLNNSWGGGTPNDKIIGAIEYVAKNGRNGKGCFVVFASGNSNFPSAVSYPADLDCVMAVGAIDRDGEKNIYSNYGNKLDIVAPTNIPTIDRMGDYGECDNNTSDPNYQTVFTGTSAACPHVAGVAALMLSVNPDLTRLQITDIIKRTAQKVGNYNYQIQNNDPQMTWCQETGYGLVDAHMAVVESMLYGTNPSINGNREMYLCDDYVFSCNIINQDAFSYEWSFSENLASISVDSNTVRLKPMASGNAWVKVNVYSENRLIRMLEMKDIVINESHIDDLVPLSSSILHFTQDTTLDDDNHYLIFDAVVEDDVTLTITGTVYCSDIASIIIKPGGKLIINGGILTNACSDKKWQGIEVWGVDSLHQQQVNGQYHQGYLELKNGAVIENAVCAVELWNPSDNHSEGGIVHATDATFRNNAKAIHACNYANYNPASGFETDYNVSFNNCSFVIDSNYVGEELFLRHVELSNVSGFKFCGCSFSVDRKVHQVSPRPYGIVANNAGLSVSRCLQVGDVLLPDINYTRSTFSGFESAIYVTNSSQYARTVSVEHSDFSNNAKGILVQNTGYATITDNNFIIGSDDDCSFGLYLNRVSYFDVEDNSFTGNDNYGSDNYGIMVRNSASYNDISQNSFNNLYCGNVALGNNIANDNYGLTYTCNTNLNNVNDFCILKENGVGGISPRQGSLIDPAGNTFSGSNCHIYNAGDNTISYYYQANNNSQKPVTSKLYNVNAVGSSNVSSCGVGDIPEIDMMSAVDIVTLENAYNAAFAAYNALQLNNQGSETSEDIKAQLSQLKTEYLDIVGEIVKFYLQQEETDYEELRQWLVKSEDIFADRMVVASFIQEGNYDDAKAYAEMIAKIYNLEGDDLKDHDDYLSLVDLYIDLHRTDRSAIQLTDAELTMVKDIANNGIGASQMMAESVMTAIGEPSLKVPQCLTMPPALIITPPTRGEGLKTTGVTDYEKSSGISIYPNPTDGKITISLTEDCNFIEIYDSFGRMMMSRQVDETTGQQVIDVDISSYPSGLYLVVVKNDTDRYYKRIVKN